MTDFEMGRNVLIVLAALLAGFFILRGIKLLIKFFLLAVLVVVVYVFWVGYPGA